MCAFLFYGFKTTKETGGFHFAEHSGMFPESGPSIDEGCGLGTGEHQRISFFFFYSSLQSFCSYLFQSGPTGA